MAEIGHRRYRGVSTIRRRPRLTLGFAGNADVGLRAEGGLWPTLIVPEVREWVHRARRTRLASTDRGWGQLRPFETCRAAARRSRMTVLAINIVASWRDIAPGGRNCHWCAMADLEKRAVNRPHRDGDDRAGGVRYRGRTQTQHLGFCVRGAGYGGRSPHRARVKIPDRGVRCRRRPEVLALDRPQRIFRHFGRSQFEQGNGFGGGFTLGPAD